MMRSIFIKQLGEKLSRVDQKLNSLSSAELRFLKVHPEKDKWSALECIEHLALYNDFYLPEFEKALQKTKKAPDQKLKRGWMGKKSAESMLPGKGNNMKTFKSKNTLGAKVSEATLSRFKNQQERLKEIVDSARGKTIDSVRCKTTLPLIRFKLSDALEFIINHQLRHCNQAEKALAKAYLESTSS